MADTTAESTPAETSIETCPLPRTVLHDGDLPTAAAAEAPAVSEELAKKSEIAQKREDIARMGTLIASAGIAADGPGPALAAMLSQRGNAIAGSTTSAESVRAHLAQMGMRLPQPPGRKFDG
uniref:Uncharacterized protein n=1 Tax=Haptolina brevifila TaxID=156173 RepID=A0A7S2MDM8_9EUKA